MGKASGTSDCGGVKGLAGGWNADTGPGHIEKGRERKVVVAERERDLQKSLHRLFRVSSRLDSMGRLLLTRGSQRSDGGKGRGWRVCVCVAGSNDKELRDIILE